jgi:hypothetical protein
MFDGRAKCPLIEQILLCQQECGPMNCSNKPIENSNSICEGLGCNAKATSQVPVKVGVKGGIVLLLCEKCKQRFSYSESKSAPEVI